MRINECFHFTKKCLEASSMTYSVVHHLHVLHNVDLKHLKHMYRNIVETLITAIMRKTQIHRIMKTTIRPIDGRKDKTSINNAICKDILILKSANKWTKIRALDIKLITSLIWKKQDSKCNRWLSLSVKCNNLSKYNPKSIKRSSIIIININNLLLANRSSRLMSRYPVTLPRT